MLALQGDVNNEGCSEKIALIASFLLRYPDEQWYNELPEWREDAQSVGHPQLRQGLLEFFDYVEESNKKEFEDQYVRTFDFSQKYNDVFVDL